MTQLPSNAKNKAYLLKDNWDDWFAFETTFYLYYFDNDGKRIACGNVKIGQKGLHGKSANEYTNEDCGKFRVPNLPVGEFETLSENFFSLGQEENYYEILGASIETQAVLHSLGDCSINLNKFKDNLNELVMTQSLLRSVSPEQVRTRFHRLSHGDAQLTKFNFTYTYPDGKTKLDFDVDPDVFPPSNVQAIIGRNGVGKTFLMKNIAKSVLKYDSNDKGQVSFAKSEFSSLIFVSFSVFDDIDIEENEISGIKYFRIGYSEKSCIDFANFDPEQSMRKDFSADFIKSLKRCAHGLRKERWLRAIKTLENDPIFSESKFSEVINLPMKNITEHGGFLFKKLSSGYAILLLIITKLIELVEEKTVVLIDEPEGHLHPPLLATFIRCLSEILNSRNAVALITTHSPIVLQEVPRRAAWILQRSGREVAIAHPRIETFGENIGVLTNEVFGLEVTNSGCNKLLRDTIDKYPMGSYETILDLFNGELGTEAKIILRSLIAIKQKDKL